jgi:hypothetical protein
MKCANCDKEAMYEYQIAKNSSIFYCGKDLPKFLDARRRAGLLKITKEYTEAKESALETLAVTLSELPEEPKPVKKAPKKSEQ